jgi:hypothetical protein
MWQGEIGIEQTAGGVAQKWKIGDGVTPWNSLPYFGGGGMTSIAAADSTVVIDNTNPLIPTIRFTHIPTATMLGRVTAATGPVEALTPAQVRALVLGLTSFAAGSYLKGVGTSALQNATPAVMQADMFSGCLVSRATTFAVASGGAPATDMDWDAESYDVGGYFNTGIDNSAFIIPAAGRYEVCAQINFAANVTGMRVARMFVSRGGGAYANEAGLASNRTMAVTGASQMTEMSLACAPLDLAAGDKILIRVGQDSGASLNVVSAPVSWFGIWRVG